MGIELDATNELIHEVCVQEHLWNNLWSLVELRSTFSVLSLAVAGTMHTMAGTMHTMAGTMHTMSGTMHTMAGTMHTMAGTMHTMAGTMHTMAGTMHTMAGTMHTMAGTTYHAVLSQIIITEVNMTVQFTAPYVYRK